MKKNKKNHNLNIRPFILPGKHHSAKYTPNEYSIIVYSESKRSSENKLRIVGTSSHLPQEAIPKKQAETQQGQYSCINITSYFLWPSIPGNDFTRDAQGLQKAVPSQQVNLNVVYEYFIALN